VDIRHGLVRLPLSGNIELSSNGCRMRALVLVLSALVIAACALFPSRPNAQVCTDDYATVDTWYGTILDIVPAPEPFSSADMRLKGPENCTPMWMQVLKSDAVQCRLGDKVEARGIIVSDPENGAWNINPEHNTYMLLGQDFACTR
jgi:hypothetical protein